MSTHVDHLAEKQVARVRGMQRIYLSMLRAIEIVDVVALNGLIQEKQPQGQDEERDDEQFPTQEFKIPGTREARTREASEKVDPGVDTIVDAAS